MKSPLPLLLALCASLRAASAGPCFGDHDELKTAVDQYMSQDCSDDVSGCAVGSTYGWPMNTWCVSEVTTLEDMFANHPTFNEEISDWDVAKVTNMRAMFAFGGDFDGDLSSWDTDALIDNRLFYHRGLRRGQRRVAHERERSLLGGRGERVRALNE